MSHQWQYLKSGILGEDQVGPISEEEIKQLAIDGEISKNTKISSPTRTKNQWVLVKNIPTLIQLVERGVAERTRKKQAAKESKSAEKQLRNEAKKLAPVNQSDAVDSKAIQKIKRHVEQYMTESEEIEFVCVQGKPIAIKADAVVVTNRRLMIVQPKLLGRFEFIDLLWRDLGDAHVKENVLGATFSMRHSNGGTVSIDMLPKADARKLYGIAQQREEQAVEIRRQRKMEETAAGAMNINIGQTPAVPEPLSASQSSNDMVARLKQLKDMLDAGLIEQADFDDRKTAILNEI